MAEEQEDGGAPKGDSKTISLKSLAPEYVKDEHALYVAHLERAVADETVRNVALTGRYGSGKSSILDKFIEAAGAKRLRVQRISINTLGPDEGEDITNRIQKELVKQLVYRAAPGKIRRSRFARTADLTDGQLVWQSAIVAVVVAALLWLTGVRPTLGFGGDAWWPQPSAFALLVVLLALATGVARRFLRTRRVSQVSAAGTAIQLEDRPDSYFDKYLDELMVYFEITDPDIVIFEDLDRFDDPQIFDSLRELNTLINSSHHWAPPHKPLRFVYAIKDSLFEKLGKEKSKGDEEEVGKEPAGEENGAEKVATRKGAPAVPSVGTAEARDTAAAAVERANRTKFFELVIPIVPFLSHSNARDHLIGLLAPLQARENDKISRGLIDIVARHSTDMRLMINIRNEYVVFAQRLLWGGKGAPGLDANALFALVAYKNFHLADFEALPHRGSVLDTLESERRTFVRKAIEDLEQERRDLHRANAVQHEQERRAAELGERLTVFATAVGAEHRRLDVGDENVDLKAAGDVATWKTIAGNGSLTLVAGLPFNPQQFVIGSALLQSLFPEGTDPDSWLPADDQTLAGERSKIDEKIARLRGASFADLAREADLKVDGKTFESHLASVLQSDLARDLVRQGFIDRYYAEYAAVFYGKFLGVDVANFFRNTVWPNDMDLDAEFKSQDAIPNVLEQAPEGFTRSRSVLNPPIVRYLLGERPELAREVVDYLVTHEGDDSVTFLEAFFAHVDKESAEKFAVDLPDEAAVEVDPAKTGLVTLLATHPWPGLFDYLASDEAVPDEATRTALLDAALLGAENADSFGLNDDAAALIRERHQSLAAFTQEPKPPESDASAVAFGLAERADLEVPDLRPLSKGMRKRFVKSWRYELTADNLRAALELSEESPIGLEELYGDDEVWAYCRAHLDDYVAAVENDSGTEWTATTSEALVRALNDKKAKWSEEQERLLVGVTASSASIPDSREVPVEAWPLLAAASRLVPSLDNLARYGVEHGIDQSLARLLAPADSKPVTIVDLQEVEMDVAQEFIVRVLNANATLALDTRVAIAKQIHDGLELEAVEADALKPSEEDLLARLLEAKMVPDTTETFAHFLARGWSSASAAFEASKGIHQFLAPDLIAGHEMELLRDPGVPDSLKEKVLGEFDAYLSGVADTDLASVLVVARRLKMPVALPHLQRVAAHAPQHDDVLWHLAEATKSAQPDADGPVMLNVLAALGDHYSDFASGSGTEIDLERTALLEKVIEWLRDAQILAYAGGTNQWRLKLKLL